MAPAFIPAAAPASRRAVVAPAASVCARALPQTSFIAPLRTRVAVPPVAPMPPTQQRPATVAPTMLVTTVVGDNEPVESALRRFKREVIKSGHLFELKRRRYFETNTEKRIRKAAAARRKAKMARSSSRQRPQH